MNSLGEETRHSLYSTDIYDNDTACRNDSSCKMCNLCRVTYDCNEIDVDHKVGCPRQLVISLEQTKVKRSSNSDFGICSETGASHTSSYHLTNPQGCGIYKYMSLYGDNSDDVMESNDMSTTKDTTAKTEGCKADAENIDTNENVARQIQASTVELSL